MSQIPLSFFMLSFFTWCVNAQQNYSENSVFSCNNNDEKEPSPAFLYTCNGLHPSCQAFLIFKSEPPYNSVHTISILTSSNPSELAQINNATRLTVFPTGKEVIVPVNCSCSGQYYQANTTFNIPGNHETYFIIANNTFQGLSTCDALKRANPYSEFSLQPGLELQVPLRCACPTRNQTSHGTKYLLTYLVMWDDNIPDISDRFNISTESVLDANGFSEGPVLFPFTTILVPLPTKPLSSQTITHNYTLISPSPSHNPARGRPKRGLHVGIGIAAGCSLLVLGVVLSAVFLLQKKKRAAKSYREGKAKLALPKDLLVEIDSVDQVLKVFKFEELKKATENFSSKSRIKGSVYRGVFSGGEVLAIKVTSADVSREVNMLSKINHFNLIKLHGICEKHGCFYLVFEYMKNGSLREWLCNKNSKDTQSQTQRIQIALDVAYGLHYLHSFTKPAYVHKDINSSNVLLNSDLRAKISNFTLVSTSLRGTDSATLTTSVAGTRGYMAPEYIEAGSVTPKIDIYAFGIVMLELITGKDAVFVQDGREVLLSAKINSIMEGENAETELGYYIDPSLKGNDGMEFTLSMAKLSITCLRQDPANRPSMGEVVSTLLKIQADLHKSQPLNVEFA